MRQCASCIITENYPCIDFDEDGVCSLCREHTPPPPPAGEEALEEAVAPFRGSGEKYDCIVAFSGGRDSTYILWHAVRELGLSTLALFTDNGFVPDHTYRNLHRTTDLLGVDLRVEKYSTLRMAFPGMLRAWMRKPSPATVGLLCTGCSYGRRMKLPGTAGELRIPLMMVGGGEPERSFAERLLLPEGEEMGRKGVMKGFVRELGNNPRIAMSPVRTTIMGLEFALRYLEAPILRMLDMDYPKKKVFPFRYLGWDESVIMGTIEEELNWESGDMCGTPWRSDCLIAPLKNYIYGRMLGFHKVDEILAGMVRLGHIDRDTAMKRLESESWVNPSYLDGFLKDCGTSLARLDRAIDHAAGGGSSQNS